MAGGMNVNATRKDRSAGIVQISIGKGAFFQPHMKTVPRFSLSGGNRVEYMLQL